MASPRYLGHAAGVKKVYTITIALTWAQNDTITITIDNIDVVITIGTLVTVTQVATTIKEAFNGSTLTDTSASYTPNSGIQTIGQFAELTATSSAGVVSLTANTAGKDITISIASSTAGDGTATLATATAATGKYHYDNIDNFSGNAVPVNNDNLAFDIGSVGPQYGLTTNLAQPATLTITKAFTGLIGLAEQNIDNPTYPFAEYRTRSLTFNNNSITMTARIGEGEGQGSSRIRLDHGAGAVTWYIYGSGAREVAGVPAILLAGTAATNELNNFDGDVGVAYYFNQTAALAALRNGNGPASQAKTYCGSSVDLSGCTIKMVGGALITNSAVSTYDQTGGETFHQRGDITTANIWGGIHRQRAGGTITTLKVGTALFDKSANSEPLTITNAVQLYKGAKIYDPQGTITFSAGFVLNGCTWADVEVVVGFGRTYTPS